MSSPSAVRRYQLLHSIASGGMAEIFLARIEGEAGFSRPCVIKRIHRHLVAAPGFVEMFLDEARLAARLSHPGIAQILDLGREGTDYFIALEYLDGRDLSAVLSRCAKIETRMPIDVALKIAAAAAEALHYAHEARDESGRALNIVHRDVSPSNLFLTFQGAVKVLDFGIARANFRFQQTAAGQIKGKAAYMSPEQTRGDADRRADVWALGVCLHEMLTGERLFVGRDWIRITDAVRSARIPRPSETRREVPEDVDVLVMAALERDVERRTPTAEALRAHLEEALRARSYVSPTSQLGAFLKFLYEGEPEPAAQAADAPRTGEIITISTSEVEVATVVTQPSGMTAAAPAPATVPQRRPPQAGRGRWVAAVLALALLAGLGFLSRRDAPVEKPVLAVAVPNPEPEPERAPAPVAEAPAPIDVARPAPKPPRPPSAWLSVETSRPITVLLDGVAMGSAPLKRTRVAPGEHRLTLEGSGQARNVTFNARAGEEIIRRESFRSGVLNVTVEPWADVFLDGTRLGQTPLVREIWEGSHALKLVGPNGASRRMDIEMQAGKSLVIDETFAPAR